MTRITPAVLLTAVLAVAPAFAEDARPDLVVADFESETYGDWKATGEAFGDGPAKGTLPGQMHVDGYQGERLVNSFRGGDDATGSLVSPPFTIERKHVNLLVGGGKYPGETCVNLLVGGKAVRTATGPNDRPGGSERLDSHSWDVAEFAGREATIEIVDHRKGGWGHVSVDQIEQSDRPKRTGPASREIAVETRYLHLPVKNGAPKRRMTFVVAGETVREFDVELADAAADWFAFADVSAFSGETLRVEVDRLPAESQGLAGIVASDEIPDAGRLYREPLRPGFHFTSRRGWLNDPNGLVYADGEWHLFYQHNPFGIEWGNMHWGHAVSTDLVRWKELPIALYPRRYGDWAFSGSAVLDHRNTSGFGTGGEPPLVLAYTSTGRGECVAYSSDRGRTWAEFAGNPVVRHEGRDPKLVRHEPTGRWVMAVYQEKKEGDAASGRFIAFYSSPDLKDWTFESRIEGFYECPDLFELPVDGDDDRARWVLYAADGEYLLGDFDGRRFTPEGGKRRLWHGNFYAAQTYDNTPDGRRVQIGWARGVTFPGMPFNQQMNVPVDLTLRTTSEGVCVFAEPVPELDRLRGRRHARTDLTLSPEPQAVEEVAGDLLDVEAEIEPGEAATVTLAVRGVPVVYDAKAGEVSCRGVKAPLPATDGTVRLRVLADRGSLEVFGNDGRAALSVGVVPPPDARPLAVSATGGGARVRSLVAYELRSAWEE